MGRKTGGLAAIMSGQPMVVVKKRSMFWRLRLLTRQGGLHVGLICVCMIYVYAGAMFFKYLEVPEEEKERMKAEKHFDHLREDFILNVERVKLEDYGNQKKINESVARLLDGYSKNLMKIFTSPIAANMFDCLFYARSNYTPLWTTDSALLFTATTIIPVGYGYITPVTPSGRILLCIYAGFGIPLVLVMMSDVGKFLADLFVKLFNENVTAFMIVLVFLLVAYSIVGGIAISKTVGMPMVDGIYFSTITIFTIGYGDISPSIPTYVVLSFIVFGVTLVTISIDVVAANIIHNIHYMGRQVGKARVIADKMILMAQKLSISRGLGLGMAQLGAFAKMGMMINVNAIGAKNEEIATSCDAKRLSTRSSVATSPNEIFAKSSNSNPRKSTAFEPNIDFDMIDYKPDGPSSHYFGYASDDQSDNSVFI